MIGEAENFFSDDSGITAVAKKVKEGKNGERNCDGHKINQMLWESYYIKNIGFDKKCQLLKSCIIEGNVHFLYLNL